jgi:Cohesin domain
MNVVTSHFKKFFTNSIVFLVLFLCVPLLTQAATLAVSPGTGVYKTGATFTVTVFVNTAGVPVNAADGTLSYNPRELSVVSVSRASSIFNLWTTEPTFSNTAGTVTFSGGVPTGYTGAAGNVLSVTFRSLTSGAARVSLTGASVLAADGRGTNVLTGMSGGTYTLSAVESQPAPEVIVEFVPPANTPNAPVITSTTHPDQAGWSKETTAILNWSVPAGVTAVRTGLDKSPVAIPTKVYDSPIKTLTLSDLDEGVSYLHVQFRNEDGWGKVAHYKLSVDSKKPESFTISLPEGADVSNPNQILNLVVTDSTSPVTKFKVQLDGAEPYEHTASSTNPTLPLTNLTPGYHTVVVEAFDAAGNSLIASYSFTITSFEKPLITEFPATLNAGVIPVIKGTTKPNATVSGTLTDGVGTEVSIDGVADGSGLFTIIPPESLKTGRYTLFVTAKDVSGGQSEPSDTVTIVVSEPGYVAVGSFLISFFSILIPLIALVVLTWITFLYALRSMGRMKAKVIVESEEAAMMLATEFRHLDQVLAEQEAVLVASHKTKKLTKAEEEMFAELKATIAEAKRRVGKEVDDVTHVFKK